MASHILLTNATQQSTGLKNLLYDANIQAGQRSMLIALVNGAYKERDQLFACAEEEGILMEMPWHLQPPTETSPQFFDIQVALYECLLGSRRVRGTSELVDFVKTRKQSLQMTLAARRKRGAAHSYVPRIRMPRYVRVNHLRLSMPDAIAYMKSSGYKQVVPASDTNNYTSIAPKTFMVDPSIPSLLILPPSTSFHGDAQVDAGALVLQDRSSCLTALALSPPPDAHVIDTCSAPGNKTLHVASIMSGGNNGSSGTITAFERSENRFHTLSKRIDLQGASDFCTPVMRDFMTVNTQEDFLEATHVLIDPSCSGSGLVATYSLGETPELGEAEHEMVQETVASLAREQQALILHAMSLTKAKVIAYSTCSVHRTENEDVVLAVLAERSDWHLVQAVPQWPHRGLDLPEFADIKSKVCRADFEKDGTNGFFVARFERTIAAVDEDKLSKKKRKKQRNDDSDDDDAPRDKSSKKKRKEKKNVDSEDDDASPTKKSKKKKTKRKVEEPSLDDDDDDSAVNKPSDNAEKKQSKRRENETKEERRERKAKKKERRLKNEPDQEAEMDVEEVADDDNDMKKPANDSDAKPSKKEKDKKKKDKKKKKEKKTEMDVEEVAKGESNDSDAELSKKKEKKDKKKKDKKKKKEKS
jgi:putative methyltransferase